MDDAIDLDADRLRKCEQAFFGVRTAELDVFWASSTD